MSQTAAYKGIIKNGGTSTATTAEACTNTTGNSYQITASSKRVIDPAVARTWKDGGVAISASSITSEDLNNGTVTLTAPAGGAVTVDCNYIPLSALAQIKKASCTFKGEQIDVSTIDTYGHRKRITGQLDFEASLDLLEDNTTNLYGTTKLADLLSSRLPLFVQIDLSGAGSKVFRAWMVATDESWSLDPASAIMVGVKMQLTDRGTATALAGVTYGSP